MPSTPQPTWRPITWLPTIGTAIDGGRGAAQESHGTLDERWERPYSLDEATLARVRRVYGEQAGDVELYAEQLRRWQAGRPNDEQRREIERLSGLVECCRHEVAQVLGLADELKNQTIEALMRKSDLELGIEALLGQKLGRPPARSEVKGWDGANWS